METCFVGTTEDQVCWLVQQLLERYAQIISDYDQITLNDM